MTAPLPTWPRGVLHCQHGQWGLEALIPWWLRAGTCTTSNPEETNKEIKFGEPIHKMFHVLCYMFGVCFVDKSANDPVNDVENFGYMQAFLVRKSLKVWRSVMSSV